MAQEVRWSTKRRRQEILDAERFMESMGVPLSSCPSQADQEIVRIKWTWSNWVGGWTSSDPFKTAVRKVQLSRGQFEPGEVEFLKAAWAGKVMRGKSIANPRRESCLRSWTYRDQRSPKLTRSLRKLSRTARASIRSFCACVLFILTQILACWVDQLTLVRRCALRSRIWLLLRPCRKRAAGRREGHPGREEWWGCIGLQ
jgi:hypothetical protein